MNRIIIYRKGRIWMAIQMKCTSSTSEKYKKILVYKTMKSLISQRAAICGYMH